ncbi:MAG: FAD-dependent oxidoreductase, partial [Halobacteriota archaeon]|nr:FAD-dependent oxidoreductase [Halobacteriota archaeon]
TKQAMITKEHDKSIDTTIFYMDIRAYGKNFEEFYNRAQVQSGINYIKSRPGEVIETPDNKLVLRYEDLETGETKEFEADLLVLSSAITPNSSNNPLSEALKIDLDENNFFMEKDMLGAPLETSRTGVYMGGCISGPKDIPDSIAQSCGAAAKAIIPLHEARGKDATEFELPPEREVLDEDEPRVGVFVCRCGINIGGVVDVEAVTKYAETIPGVAFAEVDTFTCSDDCQTRIKNAINEHKLNRVLVAACTPKTHEPLFRATLKEVGLNPYLFEFVNIREHCSWIHQGDKELATQKAIDLVRMGVGKVKLLLSEEEGELDVGDVALVVGGGITGMTTALDLADMGFDVHLIEKEKELGGMLANINKLFPTDVPAENIIKPKIEAVESHENITVYKDADIKEINGFIGNFNTVISNGSESNFKAATVILATGSKEIDPSGYYGYGEHKGVITQLDLEKKLKEGTLEEPKDVVIITCVGARESEGRTYCCRVGCGTSIKNAKYIKELYPNANVTVLYYQDMRVFGKREEEYYRDVRYEHGVQFINYTKDKRPEVSSEGDRLSLKVYDSLAGEDIKMDADLVVLTVATEGADGIEKVQKMLKVPLGVGNFLAEAHVKIRPLDFASDGIYLCGSANFPRSVPDAISQGSGAASRASIPMGQGKVKSEGIVSIIDEEICVRCGTCEPMCPYSAIKTEEDGRVYVLTALCKGCGTCAAACPTGAVDQRHFQNDQIIAQIKNVFYYEA